MVVNFYSLTNLSAVVPTSPFVPYMVVELFLILFTVSILLRMNINIASQNEIRQLKLMIYSFLAMLVFDIFCTCFDNGYLTPPKNVILLSWFGVNFSLVAGCYFWFRFIEARLRPAFHNQKLADILFLIPLTVVFISDIVSLFNGWLFYID